jgi:hypothetical protein
VSVIGQHKKVGTVLINIVYIYHGTTSRDLHLVLTAISESVSAHLGRVGSGPRI